jgi:hypothetical protein
MNGCNGLFAVCVCETIDFFFTIWVGSVMILTLIQEYESCSFHCEIAFCHGLLS